MQILGEHISNTSVQSGTSRRISSQQLRRSQILQKSGPNPLSHIPWTWSLITGLLLCSCAPLDLEYQFDDDSTRFGEASLWDDWYETIQKTNEEIVAIEACIADDSKCDTTMRRISLVVQNGKKLKPSQQLQLVNRFINRMRRYHGDSRTYRDFEDSRLLVWQQWVTLLEFMKTGGDCEDFATAKYALLKLMGYDSHDLRIVVVYERKLREYHALIAVRVSDDEVALLDIDNRIYTLRPPHYRFVYSINDHSIWDHSLDRAWKPRALRKRTDQEDTN